MPVPGRAVQRKARRCLAALVLAAVMVDSLPAAADGPHVAPPAKPVEGRPTNPHRIVLHVDNLARLEDGELGAAQARATAILQTAELEPVWVESRAFTGTELRVWVVLGTAERSERMIARLGGSADLLGMALPDSRRVYVFAERIRDYAASTRRNFDEVLGHVLAHEVGHQLLPGREHAKTGIMQPDIGLAVSTPWFTERQVSLMQRSLSAHAGVLLARTDSRGESTQLRNGSR